MILQHFLYFQYNQVLRDAQIRKHPLGFPVFTEQADPHLDGLFGRSDANRRVFKTDFAAAVFVDAVDGPDKLTAPGAH